MGEMLDEGTPPVEGTAETSAAETTPPAESGTAETSWTPSQDEWNRFTQFMEQSQPVLQNLSELLAEPEYEEEQQQYDLSDPNQLGQALPQLIEQAVNQRLGPFQPLLGQIAESEGEKVAKAELAQIQSELGEFSHDRAIVEAQVLLGSGMEPRQALRSAAERTVAYEKEIGEKAVEAYKKALIAASGAPDEAGVSGAASERPPVPTGRDRYEEALARFDSQQAPVFEP